MGKNKKTNYLVVLAFLPLITILESCNIYEKEEKVLATHTRSNGTKINIYYVDMGATTKEVIQVRLSNPLHEESVLKNFEKNYLQNSKLLNDTTLMLILKDTGSVSQDTSIINIPR